MSRTDNSLRNLKTAVLFKLAAIVVNFIARKIFVVVLTKEYLGLDGTFANILTMLSLAELGVGTAITYSMYKPLAEGDRELILSLMTLYRKFYTVIGITVGVLGAALTPFLQYIIRDIPDIPHIRLIYLMFVLDSSISYFLVYKQSLISADQKQHIVTSYQYKTSMAVTAAQCAALLLTGDYILYLALKLCATFVCNALLARKADRLYPYLKQKTVQPLPAPVRQDISKNIRAMIAHLLGSVVVFGTDNVLIAYFVGAVSVGLYSNYLLITQSLKSAYSMIFRAMTASIGNLCAAEDTAHAQAVFWRVDLLTRWIYGFSAVCLVVLFNPFISLWLGADYLFSMPIVLLIVLSFYMTGMRQSVLTFREAMGLYWYDRHKPLFESAINLAVSILLAKPFGIVGIFIGTVVSPLSTCAWIEPYVLFRHGFGAPVGKYFVRYALNVLLTAAAGAATWYICALLPAAGFGAFLVKVLLCCVLPNLFFLLVYGKTSEFHYFLTLGKSVLGKWMHKSA